MKIISHRGNLKGLNPQRENKVWAIEQCIEMGYQVEVDLWVKVVSEDNEYTNILFLSHDEPKPEDEISEEWLVEHENSLLIHCKNKEALEYCNESSYAEYFFHDKDRWAYTSNNNLICYGNKNDIVNTKFTIIMMPEHHDIKLEDIPRGIYAVCTDYIEKFKDKIYTT